MRELTVEEKKEYIKLGLNYFVDEHRLKHGFCRVMQNYVNKIGITKCYIYESDLAGLFPELFSYQPSKRFSHNYWHSLNEIGYQKRIEILKELQKQFN